MLICLSTDVHQTKSPDCVQCWQLRPVKNTVRMKRFQRHLVNYFQIYTCIYSITVHTPMQNPGIVSVWSSQSKQSLSPVGYIKSGVTLRDTRLLRGELKLCLALYLQLDQTAVPQVSLLCSIYSRNIHYTAGYLSQACVTRLAILWNLHLNLQPAINHKGNMQQHTIKQKAQGR